MRARSTYCGLGLDLNSLGYRHAGTGLALRMGDAVLVSPTTFRYALGVGKCVPLSVVPTVPSRQRWTAFLCGLKTSVISPEKERKRKSHAGCRRNRLMEWAPAFRPACILAPSDAMPLMLRGVWYVCMCVCGVRLSLVS